MNTSLMHPAALSHLGANKPEEMCILRSHHDHHDTNGDDRKLGMIMMTMVMIGMMMRTRHAGRMVMIIAENMEEFNRLDPRDDHFHHNHDHDHNHD